MSNQHVLKIHPAPLADLLSGAKTAEVRRNDRDFQVGDTVRLIEVNPETGNWTGAADHVRTISHIQTGYGLPDGMCVLSYADNAQREAVEAWKAAHARESAALAQAWEQRDAAQAQLAEAMGLLAYCASWCVNENAEIRAKEFLARHAQAEQQEAQGAQCCEPTAEEKAALQAGDCTPEELWGGSRPSCPKCIDRAALATQPAAGEPEQQTATNADDLPTKKYPLGAFDFDAPVAAGEPATSAKQLADALKLVRCFERQGQAPEWEFEVPGSFNRHVVASSEQVARAKVAQDVRREAPPAAVHGDEAVRAFKTAFHGVPEGTGYDDAVRAGLAAAMRAQAGEGGSNA